jgi:alpha-ketoglutarate-dependent taurine dioxygenase
MSTRKPAGAVDYLNNSESRRHIMGIDMSHRYSGVTTRLLDRDERLIDTEEPTPLVIERRGSSSSLGFLREFLSSNSSQIVMDIATHGAVLLRGFDLRSPQDFESAVLAIANFQGINECLMSEPGRDVVKGTRFVLHTNSLYRTGGSLYLGGFHSENYYSPDVPSYISFFCEQASQLGGETGLVNTAKLFSDLPEAVKTKLTERAYWIIAWPLAKMASRYGVNAQQMEQFCLDSGLPIVTRQGQKYASMYKPCVIEHPLTKEHALAFNYSVELLKSGLDRAIQRLFLPSYLSKEWLLHRLSWRFPVIGVLDKLDVLSRDPGTVWRSLFRTPFDVCVNEIFDKEAVGRLAMSIRNRYSSFKWRANDVLLVDNLKMAHGGMPGSGARTLRVLITNPIRMRYDSKGPGVHVVSHDSHHPTLAAQLSARHKIY